MDETSLSLGSVFDEIMRKFLKRVALVKCENKILNLVILQLQNKKHNVGAEAHTCRYSSMNCTLLQLWIEELFYQDFPFVCVYNYWNSS